MSKVADYPKGVFFMLGNEVCERFTYHGLRAILTLYLITELGFAESDAYFSYHLYLSLAYFAPLIGSILADNYFGRFQVILKGSIVYLVGVCCVSFGSLYLLDINIRYIATFCGLFILALATGSIKPNLSAFAADQFEESQRAARTQFFSFFYFAINVGSLSSVLITPLLRGRVKCFGSEYCFPLAFGVPAVFMFAAFLIFIAGYKYYKIRPADKGNPIFQVFKCIFLSAYRRLTCPRDPTKRDWLDYAPRQFDSGLVAGVRSFLAILVVFFPIPFYFALGDQQGSTWVVQARAMDGRVGPITVLPDQMNIFNSLSVLLTILLFEAWIYPAINKVFKLTPLRKIALGGILTGVAFVISGFLQLQINSTLEPLPSDGYSFLHLMGNEEFFGGGTKLDSGRNILPSGPLDLTTNGQHFNVSLDSANGYAMSVFKRNDDKISISTFPYKCQKPPNGKTRIYLSVDPESQLVGQQLKVVDTSGNVVTEKKIEPGAAIEIQPAFFGAPDYTLQYGDHERKFYAQMGATEILDLQTDESVVVVRANQIKIYWQIPQIYVIAVGEVLVSVTGLEFAYSQSSPSMKSVLQAVWHLCNFAGNVIDMVISGSHIVADPAMELFIYAGLMFAVMAVFIVLAIRYKYVDPSMFESQEIPIGSFPPPVELSTQKTE
ncbi:hypothetical protein M3Y94_00641600 [Aphelenchoides besseyi]|nr:hypothetical protein M3Y94_00641600 [Aphelenchoides besseyi]KAI6231028.1 Peptide transporter 3 [Aphelenchoides besseyi]